MNNKYFNLKSAVLAVLVLFATTALHAQDKLPAKKKIFADMDIAKRDGGVRVHAVLIQNRAAPN